MSKTEAENNDLEEDVCTLTSQIDQAAKSAEVREPIQEFQSVLAAMAKEQAEVDMIRAEHRRGLGAMTLGRP